MDAEIRNCEICPESSALEPSSEGLEEEIERCWKDWISSEEDEVEGLLIKSEFEEYARHFAQWQMAQIAARDKTLDYYTFENGEKHFARYILEMIANGWHINAVKSACEKKVKDG